MQVHCQFQLIFFLNKPLVLHLEPPLFQRAWSAIRDGNLTTLIAAGVLYWFSSSFIRGFALTLSIGVLLSMFTAITITRVYLKNVIACSWVTRHKGLFGQGKEEQK